MGFLTQFLLTCGAGAIIVALSWLYLPAIILILLIIGWEGEQGCPTQFDVFYQKFLGVTILVPLSAYLLDRNEIWEMGFPTVPESYLYVPIVAGLTVLWGSTTPSDEQLVRDFYHRD